MGITQYSQTDPQWKNNLLGFDKTSTIGGYGCLLTSMSMCATLYGAPDITPASLNVPAGRASIAACFGGPWQR